MKKQFQKSSNIIIVALIAVGTFQSCSKNNGYGSGPTTGNNQPLVFAAGGDSAAAAAKLNLFRAQLGDPLNSAPGVTGGRREINWDAVPAAFTNQNNFPSDFFGLSDPTAANARKRGLIMQGTGFRVDSTNFSEIDPSYGSQFYAFSQKRLFISATSTVTDISFKMPGTTTDAFVYSFGVVFADVDDANSTSIEFFTGNTSVGVYKAPVSINEGGFSFLGVSFTDKKITRVKITSGNAVLATGVKDITNGGTKDLVAMDDFIYDEPKPLN